MLKHESISVENTSSEITFAFKQKWDFKIAGSIKEPQQGHVLKLHDDIFCHLLVIHLSKMLRC